MIVYCISNSLDNKKYVGQTTRSLGERWKEHLNSARQPSRVKMCPYLYAAMNKYGFDKFSISEIDHADDVQSLDDIEELWIAKLGTTDRNFGYNISFGGSARPHPDTRAKLSASLKGKPAWNKGKPMSEEHYKNALASGIWTDKKPVISAEARRKIRESKLGENNPNYNKPEAAAAIVKWRKDNPNAALGDGNPMWRKDVSDSVILQFRSIGFSQQQIADRLGCSQKTVGNRIKKYPDYV